MAQNTEAIQALKDVPSVLSALMAKIDDFADNVSAANDSEEISNEQGISGTFQGNIPC